MDEKLKSLWANNRVLFFILLPLIIVVVLVFTFRDLVLALLIGSARKVSDEAKKQDDQLKTQADTAKSQSDVAKAQADQIDKTIQDRKEGDISEDWNKKGN